MNKSKYHNHKKVFLIFTTLSLIVGLSYFYAAEKRKIQLSNMVKYHTKMIKSGSISSLVELGKMYEKGEGVKKDLTKAQELFKKAINFNEYLDEIYPSYSDIEANDDDSNVARKKETQLNNIRTNVKNTEQENHKSTSSSMAQKKLNPKYVPYITKNKKTKNPFKRVILVNKKSDTKSIKSVVLMDSTKKNKQLKKITHKTQTDRRKKKKKSSIIAYKKSQIKIKPPKKTVTKKPKLQAKRSPTLYEERLDYETELGIFEDEELQDTDDDDEIIIPVQTNTKEKQTISNFISNPCATESARYIAKCRRANRQK